MQTQMHVPTLSRVNKFILIAYIGLFLISSVLNSSGVSLVSYLALSLSGLETGLIYQLITFPFIDVGFTTVLFNGLLLWFIGSELETKWGEKFYLTFLGVSVVSAALFFVICYGLILGQSNAFIFGLAGVNLALIVAYGLIYSERTMVFMFIFPMKAKYFCLLLGAIQLYMGIFSSQAYGAWSQLAAVVGGFIFLKYRSLKARGVTISAIRAEQHRRKMKSKLSLVKDEEQKLDKPDSTNPKYWQ